MSGFTITKGALTAMALMLGTAAVAQEQAAAPTVDLARIAPAILRQDLVRGAYEVIELPGSEAVVIASTPAFEDKTPGFLDYLDRDDLSPIRRIELPRRAFALGLDRERGRLFVGNTLDGSLSVVDAASGLLLDTIQLGKPDGEGFEHTRMVEVDPDSGKVFVTSPSDTGTLWIVDPAAGNAVQRIDDAGLWAAGLAMDAQAGRAYLGGGGMNEVLVVDTRTGERVGTFSTGDATEPGKEGSRHFLVNLAIDAKGGRLMAADAETGSLYVFDTASGKVIHTVPVGVGTLDVAYAAATDQIFVTYRGESREQPDGTGGLVVIDGADYAPVANIPMAGHPNSLSLSEDGQTLFLTVKAPMGKEHPLYREGALDSVLRLDLTRLSETLRAPAAN